MPVASIRPSLPWALLASERFTDRCTLLRRVLMRSVYGNGPCTVQAQCRYTHPRSPEGPERGVTPSAILLAHHPRIVYHLTFELGLQCPTIPAFSALSHCEAVVLQHFARGMSRMRFTEFFPKEPSSTYQYSNHSTWFRSKDL